MQNGKCTREYAVFGISHSTAGNDAKIDQDCPKYEMHPPALVGCIFSMLGSNRFAIRAFVLLLGAYAIGLTLFAVVSIIKVEFYMYLSINMKNGECLWNIYR